jgi:methionine-rich copper-binding protein CopC
MNITHRTISTLRQLLLSLVVLCFASNALAHAGLEKSIPAANAMVDAAPPELVLEFENPIMLMKLTLTDKMKGTAIDLNFKASSTLVETHKFPLPKLENGHYVVNWTAMGKDGHNMSGEFAFMVGSMKGMKTTETKHDDMKEHADMDHAGHTK